MGTAIVINLDYENQSIVQCRNLWAIIEARMLIAGFVKKNRCFLSNTDTDSASRLACGVMAAIEHEYAVTGHSATACLRDFYAVQQGAIIHLTVPVSHAIEVNMMSTGAFQKFFG